jgi:hypothetical protein
MTLLPASAGFLLLLGDGSGGLQDPDWWIRVLFVPNLFVAAVIAGGLLQAFRIIVFGLMELDTVTQVRVHQTMLFLTPDRFMQPCGIIGAITAVVILLLLLANGQLLSVVTLFLLIGLGGNAGVMITSRYFGTRINAIIATWSLDAIPPEYPIFRRKWDITHTLRMCCGFTMFLSYLLAALFYRGLGRGEPVGWDLTLLTDVLRFVNIFAVGILTGGMFMVGWNILPQRNLLEPAMGLKVHHAMFDMKKDSHQRPCGLLAALSAIALVVLFAVAGTLTAAKGILYALGLAGIVAVIILANRWLIPFHTKVRTWSPEAPPAECSPGLQTFQKVSYALMAASSIALVCFLTNAIVL